MLGLSKTIDATPSSRLHLDGVTHQALHLADMYLTREAAVYLSRRSRATIRPKRPQGDLRTMDCREPIIGLIIVVAIVGDAAGMLQEAVDAAPSGGTRPVDDESGNDVDAGNV